MEGELVVVEPLSEDHEEGLFAAASTDAEVSQYLSAFPEAAETPERFHGWMEEALAESAAGHEGAFAILDRASGAPIGSTRYLSPYYRGFGPRESVPRWPSASSRSCEASKSGTWEGRARRRPEIAGAAAGAS